MSYTDTMAVSDVEGMAYAADTLAACSMTWDAVAAICLGMAGVDTPQDQAALTHAIQDWFPQDVGMTSTFCLSDLATDKPRLCNVKAPYCLQT